LVPKGNQYGESNGYVTGDVTWPLKIKSWPQYA